jgi:hypothetical protein
MSHSAAVWPPLASILGAAGCRNHGPLPPVYPLLGIHGRLSAFSSPGGPCLPPGLRVLTPLPPSLNHSYPPHHLTNGLSKRLRLS